MAVTDTEPSPADKARDLYRRGKYAEAVSIYNKMTESGANAVTGYAGLARVALAEHKVADAFAAASRAVELAPDSADAHVALGDVYFRQGKIASAEQQFIGVIDSGEKNADAYMGLARTERAASYYALANRMIASAHSIDPDDPEIFDEWWQTLSPGKQLELAQTYLDETDENADKDAYTHWASEIVRLELAKKSPPQTCHLASKITSTQIKLESLAEDATTLRGFGLVVRINGVPAKLQVDTGSGGILLNRKTGEKAGIKKIGDTEIGGIGDTGPMRGYIGFADSIRVGDLEFQNCPVEVSDRRSILDDDGLIGADVFAQFLIDLNFPDRKFGLSELPKDPKEADQLLSLESGNPDENDAHNPYIAPEMKSFTRVYRFGHALLIPTSLNGTPPRLFLVDTGAFDNTITPEAARETTKVHLGGSGVTVKGLSGNVEKVYTADHVKIQFAHFQQERDDLLSFDMTGFNNSIGTEASGTLGFRMLFMLDIKIDYRDGLIDFSYDPNRFH